MSLNIDMTPLMAKDPHSFFYGTEEQRTVPVVSLQAGDEEVIFYVIGNKKGFTSKGSHYRSCTVGLEFPVETLGPAKSLDYVVNTMLIPVMKTLTDDLFETKKKFKKASVLIQKHWRGFRARKALPLKRKATMVADEPCAKRKRPLLMEDYLETKEKFKKASVRIQKHWRGFRDRRDYPKLLKLMRLFSSRSEEEYKAAKK